MAFFSTYSLNHLTYMANSAIENTLAGRGFYTRFTKSDNQLIYRSSRAYESVLAHNATRLGLQLAEHYTNLASEIVGNTFTGALSRVGHRAVNKVFKDLKEEQEANRKNAMSRESLLEKRKVYSTNLISEGQKIDDDLGMIRTKEGHQIIATNPYGVKVPEALIMWYDENYQMSVIYKNGNDSRTIQTSTMFVIDINAQVSHNTSKNIILTKVEGRDFTRKELVSGGDFMFTINGVINSNMMDVYPEVAVKKLIQLCKYNGVINVSHLMFKQFGVNKVIIQDFKLNPPENKNEQPYSISCVAVEPDEDTMVKEDTIEILNRQIADNSKDGWYRALLDQKAKDQKANEEEREKREREILRRKWLYNHI